MSLSLAMTSPLSNGTLRNRRNCHTLEKGSTRRKARREAISSRRFWIGVPVRHHLDLALSLMHVLWKVVVDRRISWATCIRLRRWWTSAKHSYLHPKQFYTSTNHVKDFCWKRNLSRESCKSSRQYPNQPAFWHLVLVVVRDNELPEHYHQDDWTISKLSQVK